MDLNTLEIIDDRIKRIQEDIQKVRSNDNLLLEKQLDEQLTELSLLFKKQQHDLQNKEREVKRLDMELTRTMDMLKIKNNELREWSVTDKITGLFSCDQLMITIEDEIARCGRYGYPLALMIVSIDDFDDFLDKHGFLGGDKMLAFAGSMIKNSVRKFDRAFRFKNAEFIIVLPETDLTLAYMAAERLRKDFRNSRLKGMNNGGNSEENASGTVSIGITAVFPYTTDNISIAALFVQMERALHQAKSNGGDSSIRYE